MAEELRAKPLVESRIEKLKTQVHELTQKGFTPSMKVILVGNNSASQVYVSHKKKLCEKVAAKFELVHLDENISEEAFLKIIDEANNDKETTGLFIQLPIPKHLSHIDTTALVDPKKDVDGFHFKNVADIYSGNETQNTLIPCTPKGIISLLDFHDVELEGKHVVVIGRSLIVGKPMALLLTNRNATVTLCHSRSKELSFFTKSADIIISAVGKERWLGKDYISTDKEQIIIDVGINRDSQAKLCGDINFDEVKDQVSMITPVPGGVGPLTVLSLLENLILATKNQHEAL